jgi:hypothetical protein
MRQLCLDRMNNLFSFVRVFRTYTKGKGLTTQATTPTSPYHQEGYGQPMNEHTIGSHKIHISDANIPKFYSRYRR